MHELLEILVAMLRGYLGEVYRAKGYAPIGGQWTRFDIADKQYRVAQMLFLQADEPCAVSYRDRGGKYQGQTGVTLPRT